jgi:competence protein ComEA
MLLLWEFFPYATLGQEATMYSGMTRNEVRGILALALVAALGVGARAYLSETPRRDVWVERPAKQAVAAQATPSPSPITLSVATPVASVTPAPTATPVVVAVPATPAPTPNLPVASPQAAPKTPEAESAHTVVIAPNLPNAQSVVIAPNVPQAHSVTVEGGAQATATPVPTRVATPAVPRQTTTAPFVGIINLNTATLADLDKLPGIGPKIGQKILDYRAQRGAFRSVDDLINVPGIGPKTIEKIRPNVRVN